MNINWPLATFILAVAGLLSIAVSQLLVWRKISKISARSADTTEERRANANPSDVSGWLAIIYTIGFIGLAVLLYFYEIPASNKDALLYLFGILSGIELTIIAFYFGGNKAAEATQRATEQRQGRAAAVVEEIAKAAAPVTAAAVAAARSEPAPPIVTPTEPAVTPAPMNPATGNTPAAESVIQTKELPK